MTVSRSLEMVDASYGKLSVLAALQYYLSIYNP